MCYEIKNYKKVKHSLTNRYQSIATTDTSNNSQCLTPSFWQQLPDRGCSHLGEESSSMDGTEVREIAIEIELLCHHSESSLLQGKNSIAVRTSIILNQYTKFKPTMNGGHSYVAENSMLTNLLKSKTSFRSQIPSCQHVLHLLPHVWALEYNPVH